MFMRVLFLALWILPLSLSALSENEISTSIETAGARMDIITERTTTGIILHFPENVFSASLEQSGKVLTWNGKGSIALNDANLEVWDAQLTFIQEGTILTQTVMLTTYLPNILPPWVEITKNWVNCMITFTPPDSIMLQSRVFITTPKGRVIILPIMNEYIESTGMLLRNKEITLSFLPEEHGVYRIEIPDETWRAWLNGVYVSGDNILPILSLHETNTKIETDGKEVLQNQLKMINTVRMSQGINHLVEDTTLSKLAQAKADDMIEHGYFSHINPTGYNIGLFAFHNNIFLPKMMIGENLARGYTSDSELFESFLHSGGHRWNILNPEWRKVGIGYSIYNGMVYVVQVFWSM